MSERTEDTINQLNHDMDMAAEAPTQWTGTAARLLLVVLFAVCLVATMQMC